MGKRTGRPRGRPKGRPNKVNREMREQINEVLQGEIDKVKKYFAKLEPAKHLELFERYLKHTLPPLQNVSLSGDLNKLTDEQIEMIFEKIKTLIK